MSRQIVKNSSLMLVTLFCGLLVTGGCIKSQIAVLVNPDGTGTIEATTVFSQDAVTLIEAQLEQARAQMAQMKKQMEENGVDTSQMGMEIPDNPFFNEDALRQAAGMFGPGVKLLKAEAYEKDGTRGSVAVYAFEDVNQIYLNLDRIMEGGAGGIAMRSPSQDEEIEIIEKSPYAYEFNLEKADATARLTVTVPQFPPYELPDDLDADEAELFKNDEQARQMLMGSGNPLGLTGEETEKQLMKRILTGMEVVIQVEAQGEPVKVDATHVDPDQDSRMTMVRVNMEQAMTDERFFVAVKKLEETKPESPLMFFSLMKHFPGTKLETKKQALIEFK